MEKNEIVLIGIGEFAQLAYEYFTFDSNFKVVAFSVNREYLKENKFNGLPVVAYEELEKIYPCDSYKTFVAIPASDMNRTRKKFYEDLKDKGYQFATYISSKAFIWRNTEIGENTFVFENNTLQPYVKIGNNCILWSGNHVGHRTVIEDHCFVTSHVVISGYCKIGQGSFLGVNSTINDNINIGEWCLLGSASLISKDTEPQKIYVGNPARAVPNKTSFDAGI